MPPLILPVKDKIPVIGNDCFIADNATIVGDVTIGNQCSVWFNAVVRGDVNSISIGDQHDIPFRHKPAAKSPSPPLPPPKDRPFPNLAQQKQVDYFEYDEKHPPEDDLVADTQNEGPDNADGKLEIR